jgi:hypothetical protein
MDIGQFNDKKIIMVSIREEEMCTNVPEILSLDTHHPFCTLLAAEIPTPLKSRVSSSMRAQRFVPEQRLGKASQVSARGSVFVCPKVLL